MNAFNNLKKYILDTSAVAAVEFALIAPILLMLLVLTVDMGFFIVERMKLQDAASVSADYVVQTADDSNIQVVAAGVYDGNIADIRVTSKFICECSDGVSTSCPVNCGSGDYQRRFITVTASGTFSPILPYPGIADSMNLQGFSRMRVD